MKRIDIVYRKLIDLSKDQWITTMELAKALDLARSNVSADLNRLCENGRATKTGTKPIAYKAIIKEKQEFEIDLFAVKYPSYYRIIQQAKAAVMYPPTGMPMLLTGETGTGKSYFAELLYRFIRAVKEQDIPFIIFNCADYSDNAQLLLSHLFGVKKGAYTGADTDKPGLIQKADQGILFLDEIHRLPQEGQEMLFTLLDRGKFRRLGDTEEELSTQVQLIAATTESPESVLLRTFTRRIPMIINLPSLEERSIEERLELIHFFFTAEAIRLKREINVSVNTLRSLSIYKCTNNVGQLKTDIQLLCATAYSDFLFGKKEDIRIASADLPENIRNSLFQNSDTPHRDIWNKLTYIGSRFYTFSAEGGLDNNSFYRERNEQTIYELIENHIQEMTRANLSDDAIKKNLSDYIHNYFTTLCSVSNETNSLATILNLANEDVAEAISKIINFSETALGISLSESTKAGMSMHIMNAVKRLRSGKSISNPQFNKIRKQNPQEFSIAVECLKILDNTCNLSVPIEEASFLCQFFIFENPIKKAIPPVSIAVIAHGESTASSMVEVCRELLKTDNISGIDVPLQESPDSAWRRLESWYLSEKTGNDILLLVDMGALTDLGEMLSRHCQVNCKTIQLVSTQHVLLSSRLATKGESLETIYKEVRELRDDTDQPPVSESKLTNPAKCIVTICSSGEGTALMLKNELTNLLALQEKRIPVFNISLNGQETIFQKLALLTKQFKILFLVSAFALQSDFREFSVEDIYNTEKVKQMEKIVSEEILLAKIADTYSCYFLRIDPDKAFSVARFFIEAVETKSRHKLKDDVKIGIYSHIACALDKIKTGYSLPSFPDIESFTLQHRKIMDLIRNESAIFKNEFDIAFSPDEMAYIASFFNEGNYE